MDYRVIDQGFVTDAAIYMGILTDTVKYYDAVMDRKANDGE